MIKVGKWRNNDFLESINQRFRRKKRGKKKQKKCDKEKRTTGGHQIINVYRFMSFFPGETVDSQKGEEEEEVEEEEEEEESRRIGKR